MNIEETIEILQDMVKKMDCCYATYSTEHRIKALKFAIDVLNDEYDLYKKGVADGMNKVIDIIKE